MKPKDIQDNLDLAQMILGQWLRYRQFYWKGVSGENVTPDEETQFLETTSSLAQNVRKLGQRIDEKKYPFRGNEISAQLKGTISIGHFRSMPEADQKVFYREWHTSLVYLSRTVGAFKFMSEGYVPPAIAPGKTGGKGKKAAAKDKKVMAGWIIAVAVVGGIIFKIIRDL